MQVYVYVLVIIHKAQAITSHQRISFTNIYQSPLQLSSYAFKRREQTIDDGECSYELKVGDAIQKSHSFHFHIGGPAINQLIGYFILMQIIDYGFQSFHHKSVTKLNVIEPYIWRYRETAAIVSLMFVCMILNTYLKLL